MRIFSILIKVREIMKYTTGKREKIIAHLSENAQRAFTVYEICDAVIGSDGGISTVYRILSELVATGSVRRLMPDNGKQATYQYIGDGHCREHLHLKCYECGRLLHLDEGTTHKLEQAIMLSKQFAIDESAVLFGKCADCRASTIAKV